MTTAPNVAVIGFGYWGKNLIRNFHELGALRAICDADPDREALVAEKYPGVAIGVLLVGSEVCTRTDFRSRKEDFGSRGHCAAGCYDAGIGDGRRDPVYGWCLAQRPGRGDDDAGDRPGEHGLNLERAYGGEMAGCLAHQFAAGDDAGRQRRSTAG